MNKRIFISFFLALLATLLFLSCDRKVGKETIHKQEVNTYILETTEVPEKQIAKLQELEVVESKEEKEKKHEKVKEVTSEIPSTETVTTVTEEPSTEAVNNESTQQQPYAPIKKPSTKKSAVALLDHQEKSVSNNAGQTISMEATYYTADCAGCSGITATGKDVRGTIYADGYRVIAVDPSVIPLGTKVKVDTPNGSFTAITNDTGGAIQGNRVDILVGSTQEAIQNGRNTVSVTPIK